MPRISRKNTYGVGRLSAKYKRLIRQYTNSVQIPIVVSEVGVPIWIVKIDYIHCGIPFSMNGM